MDRHPAAEAAREFGRDERGGCAFVQAPREAARDEERLARGRNPGSSSAADTAATAAAADLPLVPASGRSGAWTTIVARSPRAPGPRATRRRAETEAPPVSRPRHRSRGPAPAAAERPRRRARTRRRAACRRGVGRAAPDDSAAYGSDAVEPDERRPEAAVRPEARGPEVRHPPVGDHRRIPVLVRPADRVRGQRAPDAGAARLGIGRAPPGRSRPAARADRAAAGRGGCGRRRRLSRSAMKSSYGDQSSSAPFRLDPSALSCWKPEKLGEGSIASCIAISRRAAWPKSSGVPGGSRRHRRTAPRRRSRASRARRRAEAEPEPRVDRSLS